MGSNSIQTKGYFNKSHELGVFCRQNPSRESTGLEIPHGPDRGDRHGPPGGPADGSGPSGHRAATAPFTPRCPPSSNPSKSRSLRGFQPITSPPDCDSVIVGNAATRDNPEAAEAFRRDLPVLSLPQAVRQYLLPGKTSIVITGTHGKTTTSALVSWLLLDTGRDPGFLVGGEMQNLGRGYRRGPGRTSSWRETSTTPLSSTGAPSFSTTSPDTFSSATSSSTTPTSIPTFPSVLEAFRKVVEIVPPDGRSSPTATTSGSAALSR